MGRYTCLPVISLISFEAATAFALDLVGSPIFSLPCWAILAKSRWKRVPSCLPDAGLSHSCRRRASSAFVQRLFI